MTLFILDLIVNNKVTPIDRIDKIKIILAEVSIAEVKKNSRKKDRLNKGWLVRVQTKRFYTIFLD
jgi:hypothetical protein